MNKVISSFFLCSVFFLLSSCASNSSDEGHMKELSSMADYCSKNVHSKSVSAGGTTSLSGLPLDMQHKKVVIVSSNGKSEIGDSVSKTVSYVTSTNLDDDGPGSAWINCMRLKGIYFK